MAAEESLRRTSGYRRAQAALDRATCKLHESRGNSNEM
jgi:hypothetical protein